MNYNQFLSRTIVVVFLIYCINCDFTTSWVNVALENPGNNPTLERYGHGMYVEKIGNDHTILVMGGVSANDADGRPLDQFDIIGIQNSTNLNASNIVLEYQFTKVDQILDGPSTDMKRIDNNVKYEAQAYSTFSSFNPPDCNQEYVHQVIGDATKPSKGNALNLVSGDPLASFSQYTISFSIYIDGSGEQEELEEGSLLPSVFQYSVNEKPHSPSLSLHKNILYLSVSTTVDSEHVIELPLENQTWCQIDLIVGNGFVQLFKNGTLEFKDPVVETVALSNGQYYLSSPWAKSADVLVKDMSITLYPVHCWLVSSGGMNMNASLQSYSISKLDARDEKFSPSFQTYGLVDWETAENYDISIGSTSVGYENTLYIFGGIDVNLVNNTNEVSSRLWKLKQSSTFQGAWSKLTQHVPRAWHSACLDKNTGEMWVYGGLDEFYQPKAGLFLYQIEYDEWVTQTITNPAGIERFGHAAEFFQNQIFVTGGRTSSGIVSANSLLILNVVETPVVSRVVVSGQSSTLVPRIFHTSGMLFDSSGCPYLMVLGGTSRATVGDMSSQDEVILDYGTNFVQQVQILPIFTPVITSIVGCNTVVKANGETMMLCPHTGNVDITLIGSFSTSAAVSVLVDGQNCPPSDIQETQITCRLPPRTGATRINVQTEVEICGSKTVSQDVTYTSIVLTPNSVRAGSASQSASATLDRTDNPETIRFHATGVTGTFNIFYGSPTDPKQCTFISYSSQIVTCSPEPGVGKGMQFWIEKGSERSLMSTDVINYPVPLVTVSSLASKLYPDQTPGHIDGTRTVGDGLVIHGDHFGQWPEYIKVTYGNGTSSYVCDVIKAHDNNTHSSIECTTRSGVGNLLQFTINVGGWEVSGGSSNTFSYQEAPVITGIECGIYVCKEIPTNADHKITIRGLRFSDAADVKIGGVGVTVTSATTTEIVVNIDGGTGQNIGVLVVDQFLQSQTRNLIGFKLPTITSVSGCQSNKDCSKGGGEQLDVYGENFGASGANIMVGGVLCPGTTHVLGFEHSHLRCNLPSGKGNNIEVRVIQSTGDISKSSGSSISYAVCGKGFYEKDNNCIVCQDGKITSQTNQQKCVSCSAGSVSNANHDECVACEGGKFSKEASSTCQDCPVGYYNSLPYQSRCAPCLPGTYTNTTGELFCQACKAGTFAGSVATSCKECDIGFFSGGPGQATCTVCPLGWVTLDKGAIECIECPPGYIVSDNKTYCIPCEQGTFKALSGEGLCEPCSLGEFSPGGNASYCGECIPGKYSNSDNSTECEICPAGQYAAGKAALSCKICPSGKFSPVAVSGECTLCSQNQYQPDSNQTSCNNCSTFTYQKVAGSTTCDLCGHNEYYSFNLKLPCYNCPEEGAVCGDTGEIHSDLGFWLAREKKTGKMQVYPCPYGFCEANDKCGPNRTPYAGNPLCGTCIKDYYEWGGKCVECKEANGGLIFLYVIMGFLYVMFFHWLIQETKSETKILLYFLQTALVLVGTQLSTVEWMEIFDFNLLSLGAVCIAPFAPKTKIWLGVILPVMFWIQLTFILLVRSGYWYFRHKRTGSIKKFRKSPYLRTYVGLFIFSYNSITKTCFQFLNCGNVNGKNVVMSHPGIDCDEPGYSGMAGFAVFLIIVVVVGIPSCIFGFLAYNHYKLNKLNERKFRARYGILYATYNIEKTANHHNVFWWEIYSISRRMILIAVGIIFYTNRSFKYTMMSLFNVFFLLMHLYFQPFRVTSKKRALKSNKQRFLYNIENNLETITLTLILLTSIFLSTSPIPLSQIYQALFSLIIYGTGFGILVYMVFKARKRYRIRAGKIKDSDVELSQDSQDDEEEEVPEKVELDEEAHHDYMKKIEDLSTDPTKKGPGLFDDEEPEQEDDHVDGDVVDYQVANASLDEDEEVNKEDNASYYMNMNGGQYLEDE